MAKDVGYCTLGGQTSMVSEQVCKAIGGTFSSVDPNAGNRESSSGLDFGKYVRENPLEAALWGATMLHPIGWAGRGLMAGGRGLASLYKGGNMTSRIGKGMDKLFRKDVMKPKIVPQPKNFTGPPNPFLPTVLKKGREVSPWKLGAGLGSVAGPVGLVGMGTGVIPNTAYDKRVAEQQRIAQAKKDAEEAAAADEKARQDAIQAEKDRVAGLGFFERMQEPGYWNKERVGKIGALMSYYGTHPSDRPNTTPAELFAKQELEEARLLQDQLDAQFTPKELTFPQFSSQAVKFIDEETSSAIPFMGTNEQERSDILYKMYLLHQQLPQLTIPQLYETYKRKERELIAQGSI